MGWLSNNARVYWAGHAICLLNSVQWFGQNSSHITGLSTSYTLYAPFSIHKTMLQHVIMASTTSVVLHITVDLRHGKSMKLAGVFNSLPLE